MQAVSNTVLPNGITVVSGGTRTTVRLPSESIDGETDPCPFCTPLQPIVAEFGGRSGNDDHVFRVAHHGNWKVVRPTSTLLGDRHFVLFPAHRCRKDDRADMLGGSELVAAAFRIAYSVARNPTLLGLPPDALPGFEFGANFGRRGGASKRHIHWHICPSSIFASIERIRTLADDPDAIIFETDGIRAVAAGAETGQAMIIPAECDPPPDAFARATLRLLALYREHMQGPEFNIGFLVKRGVIRFGLYSPNLASVGFHDKMALSLGEYPRIGLKWPHRATARFLRESARNAATLPVAAPAGA